MEQQTGSIICASCGCENAATSKFCRECGAVLNNPNAGVATVPTADTTVVKDRKPLDLAPEDRHLKFLVEACGGACGMSTGSRTTGYVLYKDEATDTYEIHSYYRDGALPVLHRGYTVDAAYAEEILETIRTDKMNQLEQDQEMPLCGGIRTLKFLADNGQILHFAGGRGKINDAYAKILALLRQGIDPEHMIITDYAKSWTKIRVDSQSSCAVDCYRFELERTTEGRYRILKTTPAMGLMALQMGFRPDADPSYKEIREDIAAKIEQLPTGMLFSEPPRITPPNVQTNIAMTDGCRRNILVTYADGTSDAKLWDDDLMGTLVDLIRRYT